MHSWKYVFQEFLKENNFSQQRLKEQPCKRLKNTRNLDDRMDAVEVQTLAENNHAQVDKLDKRG